MPGRVVQTPVHVDVVGQQRLPDAVNKLYEYRKDLKSLTTTR